MTSASVPPSPASLPASSGLRFRDLTGNRELFFPYTMYLAAQVALLLADRKLWRGVLGGGCVVAAFLVIRTLQSATTRVLAVELVVAAAVLGVAVVASRACPRGIGPRSAIAGVASLLAFAGLAI